MVLFIEGAKPRFLMKQYKLTTKLLEHRKQNDCLPYLVNLLPKIIVVDVQIHHHVNMLPDVSFLCTHSLPICAVEPT